MESRATSPIASPPSGRTSPSARIASVSDLPSGRAILSFDVRGENAKLDQIKRRRRLAGLLMLVFVIALVLPLWALYARSVERADEPEVKLNLVVLVGYLIFVALMAATIASGRRRLRPGVVTVRSSDTGLDVDFADGFTDSVSWRDKRLYLELHDSSELPPSILIAGTPYFLVTRHAHAALTAEAFHAIFTELQSKGLIGTSRPGPWWLFSSSSSPRVYAAGNKTR